ncbi:MAG TPA: glycosyltransferase family 2 protein [Candidatus Cloacimonadota bacterium]|nr:glycosyltransferase family 2 protein [Candidatus Cloacimonadota bacterium]HPT71583.1 glycosyltransferase family 2 protein [Candidatus Cloacimonadota bacterium]
MSKPKISIIMRSKNEMPYVKYVLRMLKSQTQQDFELVCVDSGSTDGTWESIQQYGPDTFYSIAPEEYIPGRVLNEAIQHCRGEIIVFNNADCIPCTNDWLEKLTQPFQTDPEVIATFANQLARPTANPLVKKDYARAFGDGKIAALWRHFFSLASSAVRAEVIREHPFDPTIQYSEDIEWSWRMKQRGFKITYVPDAKVEHSHDYTVKQLFKRFSGEGRADARIYPGENKPFLKTVALSSLVEWMRDTIYLTKHGKITYIPYALLHRSIQKYAYWKGYKGKVKN